MNKYDDWQRYVKEQMDKADQKKRDAAPTTPKHAVPGIDRERFAIKRQTFETDESDAASRGAKPPAIQPPERQQRATSTGQAPAPRKSASTESDSSRPTGTLASPFVSVHDVWEAAERSSKTRKISKEDSPLPAIQQKKLPGMERVSRVEPVETSSLPSGRSINIKSREEILERLVNPTLTLEEAAKVMGVCKATVRRYTAKGVLPHYRTPGNQRRFKLNDILSFIENQRK
ncbi:MAG: helix-turn-helix domain-containing protein [bacterium]